LYHRLNKAFDSWQHFPKLVGEWGIKSLSLGHHGTELTNIRMYCASSSLGIMPQCGVQLVYLQCPYNNYRGSKYLWPQYVMHVMVTSISSFSTSLENFISKAFSDDIH